MLVGVVSHSNGCTKTRKAVQFVCMCDIYIFSFFSFSVFFKHFQLPVHVHVLISLIKANSAVIFMLEIFIILFPTFFLKDENYMINILLLIIFL